MDKKQIIKELIVLVELANQKGFYDLGSRCENVDLDKKVKSKTIRAFLVDLFGDDEADCKELLDVLESSIERNMDVE